MPTSPTLARGPSGAQHRCLPRSHTKICPGDAAGPLLPPHTVAGEAGLAGSSIFTGAQECAWRDNQLRPQGLAHYNNIKIKWDLETAVLKLLKGSEQM